jgi:predicted nucleic acid-binding protein
MTGKQTKVLRARTIAARDLPRAGLTLDTGALIQLEKRNRPTWALLEAALGEGIPVRIPAAVVAEFWHGAHGRGVTALVEAATIPDTQKDAQRAGVALVRTGRGRRGPSVVDALVAAIASAHGDTVLTTDPGDLRVLAQHFRGLKVIAI